MKNLRMYSNVDINKKVGIIIPTYNNIINTYKAVESVISSDYNNLIVLVVDDGSDIEVQEELRANLQNFPNVELLLSDKNRGFAEICNWGAKKIGIQKADLLFFMNNDLIIDKNCIRHLASEFEEENVAVSGPKVYLGKTKILNTAGGYFDKRSLIKKDYGSGILDQQQFDNRKEVEFIMGCAFMISNSVFNQLNGFDENYFFYSEEADLCYRLLKNNYKIIYQPKAIAWHEHSSTMRSSTYKSLYYLVRNKLYFVKKHGTYINIFYALIHIANNYVFSNVRKFLKTIFIIFYAIKDSFFHNLGKKNSKWLM